LPEPIEEKPVEPKAADSEETPESTNLITTH